MKFVLIIILLILFVIVALIVYSIYLIRYKLFKDMVFICKSLKNNISFNKNEIAKILGGCTEKISLCSRYLLRNRNVNKILFVNNSDKNLIDEFFESIGNGDVDYEINNISYYESNFEEMRIESYEKLSKDGKMYLKLIIGIGLAVCIILI
jgi:hypothetical protein